MPSLADLAAIYRADPDAVAVTCPAPGEAVGPSGTRRVRGFLTLETAYEGGDPGLPVRRWHLRTLAGALASPAPDTVLAVGSGAAARRFSVLGVEPTDGDGAEEIAVLAPVTP